MDYRDRPQSVYHLASFMSTDRQSTSPPLYSRVAPRQAWSRLSRPIAGCRRLVLLILLMSIAIGMRAGAAQGSPSSRWYGGWVEAAPSEVGFDGDRLEAAIDEIGQLHGVQGLLLVRRGYLVAERYWRGGAQDVPHNLKSASKSVMSALVGIAIERGHLRLDQPIAELLPGYDLAGDPAKKRITVRHLLSMTSGLQSTSYQAYNEWVSHPDWIRPVLAAPQVSEPGAQYSYNTANTHLLSAILASRTGQDTRTFAQRELFDPMGIDIYDWMSDPDGIHVGGNNLWLMPRDMAKFGQLYLDRGRWGNRQLVTADWVAASTRPAGGHVHETYGGYGYLWWTPNGDGSFAAVGYGGQYILVSPRDDSVVVVTSTLASKGDYWEGALFGLLRQGIGRSLVNPRLPARAVTRAGVDLRSAPLTGGAALKRVSAGEPLDLFGRDGDWLRVRSRGLEGWLHRDRVQVETPADDWRYASLAELPAGKAPPESGTSLEGLLQRARALERLAHAPPPLPRYRTTAVVNFRRSPNLVGELVAKVPPGTEFQALEFSEAWLMAEIDGERGWLHSDFAQVIGPAPPQAREQELLAGITSLVGEIERLDRAAGVNATGGADGLPANSGSQGLEVVEAELEQMRAANRNLQDRLRDARLQLDGIEQSSSAERADLERKLAEARREAQTGAAQLVELREQAAGQAGALAAVEAQNDRLAQQLAAVAVGDGRRSNHELSTALEELQREFKTRGEQLTQLDAADRQRQRELGDARAEVERLQAALADVRTLQLQASALRDKVLAENQTLQQALTEAQQRLTVLADDNGALRQALTRAWSGQAMAVVGLDGLQAGLAGQQAEVSILRQEKAEQ